MKLPSSKKGKPLLRFQMNCCPRFENLLPEKKQQGLKSNKDKGLYLILFLLHRFGNTSDPPPIRDISETVWIKTSYVKYAPSQIGRMEDSMQILLILNYEITMGHT